MSARLAIVGAGALGGRHLQALAKLGQTCEIAVVDPSPQTHQRAATLFAEAGGDNIALRMHRDVSELPWTPDLAIVATNARERRGVVETLAEYGVTRMILEKVLFTRLADYDGIERLFAVKNVKAWVNCARRAYPRAAELKELVAGRAFRYKVSGTGWGLACNVIHHLDEAAMLAGRTDITLSVADLQPGSIPAKRPGYIELLGTLTGVVGSQSYFSATSFAGVGGDRVVTIEIDDKVLSISQASQTMTVVKGKGSRVEPYPIPLQSETTVAHVNAILAGGAPRLPDFITAAQLHRQMLSAFIGHLRTSSGNNLIDECPIT